jgi:hypothetical protein
VSRIIETIEVDVPVRSSYDQWTQFESFPQFMEGVERVVQLDDKTLEWTANIAGKIKHWRAEILEQRPDQLVSWRSTEGARNDGTVRFEPQGGNRTRVLLELDVEPDGVIEKAGEALGVVEGRVKGDLDRFKDFVEGRGQATGAWRGAVDGGQVSDDDDAMGGMSDRSTTSVGAGMSGGESGYGTTGSGSSMGSTGSARGETGSGA